jgi:hypothetical protein
MNFKLYITISLLLFSCVAAALPTAKITVKVVDELGNPVPGVKMGMGFMSPKERGEGGGVNLGRLTGITDSDGHFTGEGNTQPRVGFGANKKGYYGSSGKFKDFTGVSGFIGFRKYKPWNPTVELVLKRVVDPIPMYAVVRGKSRSLGDLLIFPVLGELVGFDLTANDWVVPHGLGTHHDFLFKVDAKRAITHRDYDITLTLKFSNLGDGLLFYKPDLSKGKSALRFPHHAPVMGYTEELVQHYERTPGVRKARTSHGGNPDNYTNYFFRVRTKLDEEGNVIGGLYGKIHGEIIIGNPMVMFEEKPYISFNYYLNPNDNDTNIEFDPEQNLFKGLPDRLKVSYP